MSWRWLIASGLLALSLTGCLVKSSDKIAQELEQSVVLITYRDKPGHGTGFFVPGSKGVCTVLTAKHVLAPSSDLSRGRAGDRSPTLPFGTGHATFTASGYWVVGCCHQ